MLITGQVLRRIAALPMMGPRGFVGLPVPPVAATSLEASAAAQIQTSGKVTLATGQLLQLIPSAPERVAASIPLEHQGIARAAADPPAIARSSDAGDKATKSSSRKCGLCNRMGHRREKCPVRSEVAMKCMHLDDEDDASVSMSATVTAQAHEIAAQESHNPGSTEEGSSSGGPRAEFCGVHTPMQLSERSVDDGKGRCAYCNNLRSRPGGEPHLADPPSSEYNRSIYTRFKCFECDKFLCITESADSSCWSLYHAAHFPSPPQA